MPIDTMAKYECDDRDDDERGLLEVFHAGNGDWYARVGYAEVETATAKGQGFPPCVRFRTSGGSHPHAVILCIAILYDIGRADLDTALWRAKSLVEALGENRDIERHWPTPDERTD